MCNFLDSTTDVGWPMQALEFTGHLQQ